MKIRQKFAANLPVSAKKDISVIENGEKIADRRSKLSWFHY